MKVFENFILKKKIDKFPLSEIKTRWNDRSFFHGNDIFNYFARNIDRRILVNELRDESEINILSLSGLTTTNTNLDMESVSSFYDLTNDFKRLPHFSDEDFRKNCEWVNRRTSTWTCYKQTWNGRTFIDTFDGSHHVAAIFRQAEEQQRSFSIRCKIYNEVPNVFMISEIDNKYAYFLMDEDTIHRINSLILNDVNLSRRNPIIYPVKPPHLIVRKTATGMIVIERIKKNKLGIDLIEEVRSIEVAEHTEKVSEHDR